MCILFLKGLTRQFSSEMELSDFKNALSELPGMYFLNLSQSTNTSSLNIYEHVDTFPGQYPEATKTPTVKGSVKHSQSSQYNKYLLRSKRPLENKEKV